MFFFYLRISVKVSPSVENKLTDFIILEIWGLTFIYEIKMEQVLLIVNCIL